jgi:hypothetical protein
MFCLVWYVIIGSIKNGFPSFEEQKSFEVTVHQASEKASPRLRILMTYDDLLQCVESKNYGDLIKSELEEYLSDEEFKHCFQMDRVSALSVTKYLFCTSQFKMHF